METVELNNNDIDIITVTKLVHKEKIKKQIVKFLQLVDNI